MTVDLDREGWGALAVQVDLVSAAHRAPRSRPPLPRARLLRDALAVLAVSVVVLALASRASAATLGGIRGGGLFTQILAGPAQGVTDTFTGAAGASLNGLPADTGQVWAVSRGSFTLTTSGTAVQSGSNTTLSTAWVQTGLTAYTAKLDLNRINSQSDSAGLYLNVDATGLSGLTVIWQPGPTNTGQIVLGKVTGGSAITALNTHTGVGVPAVGTAVTLTVVCNGTGRYTIGYGAAAPYQVTLSPADTATFSANTNAGIVSDRNNKNIYDNFSVQP